MILLTGLIKDLTEMTFGIQGREQISGKYLGLPIRTGLCLVVYWVTTSCPGNSLVPLSSQQSEVLAGIGMAFSCLLIFY